MVVEVASGVILMMLFTPSSFVQDILSPCSTGNEVSSPAFQWYHDAHHHCDGLLPKDNITHEGRVASSLENCQPWSSKQYLFFKPSIGIQTFDCFLLSKRIYFCFKKYHWTRASGEIFRQVHRCSHCEWPIWNCSPVHIMWLHWCRHCFCVHYTKLIHSVLAMWEVISNVSCLECQLQGAFMEVPEGTECCWGLICW